MAAALSSTRRTLRLRDAFAAVICGDAIGNLTPLGPLVGEPAKVAFVRTRRAHPGLTALAIENVLYTLSAAAMITAGMVAPRPLAAPDVRRRGRSRSRARSPCS